jgi:hypothetical protein
MNTLHDVLYSPAAVAVIVFGALAIFWRWATRSGGVLARVSNSLGMGLAEHARTHVLLYVLAFTLAASATADAIAENFGALTTDAWHGMGWWQICALTVKSFKPAFVAISALIIKPPLPAAPLSSAPANTSNTSAPISSS